MSTTNRADMIRNAITFLADPKVQAAPLTQRIAFLESKGMTTAEIDEALRGGSSPPTSSGSNISSVPGNYSMQSPTSMGVQLTSAQPAVPQRDWRDYFIMAIISGGITFAIASLVRRYLLPHLLPPSEPAFSAASSALQAEFDRIAEQIGKLEEDAVESRKEREREKEEVERVVKEIEEAVKEVKEGEERARDEWKEVRDEIESVKEMIPKMLSSHNSSQSATLSELQSELRSLKLLLLNRHPPSSPVPGSFSSPSVASPAPVPIGGGVGAPGWSSVAGTGRPSIPAWQLGPVRADSPSRPTADGIGLGVKGKEVERSPPTKGDDVVTE